MVKGKSDNAASGAQPTEQVSRALSQYTLVKLVGTEVDQC
jgi:hypothetical protein